MGSWNATCMISQMPIIPGMKVRAFFLQATSGKLPGGDLCSYDDVWSPICPPIRAIYDDYGRVRFDEDCFEVSFLKEWYKANIDVAATQANDECKSYFSGKIDVNMCAREFVERVERESIMSINSLIDYGRLDSVPVILAMVIEEVWEEMMSLTPAIEWTQKVHNIQDYRDDYKAGLADIDENAELMQKHRWAVEGLLSKNLFWHFHSQGFINEIMNILLDARLGGTTIPDMDRIVEDLVQFRYFETLLAVLKIPYRLSCGKGSQSENYDAYVDFFAGMKSAAEKVSAKNKR